MCVYIYIYIYISICDITISCQNAQKMHNRTKNTARNSTRVPKTACLLLYRGTGKGQGKIMDFDVMSESAGKQEPDTSQDNFWP